MYNEQRRHFTRTGVRRDCLKVWIHAGIMVRLKKFSRKSRYPMRDLAEAALEYFLKKVESPPPQKAHHKEETTEDENVNHHEQSYRYI